MTLRTLFSKSSHSLQAGAGISTSAGIPDFRSPDGLYATLPSVIKLPYPEAIFDISFFRQRPEPFYALAHKIFPGNYRPTISHSFIALMQSKGLVLKVFTQNIDCLERTAGVATDKIVEAHGSFASQSCIDCGSKFDDAAMRECIQHQIVPRCPEPTCGGLVKPDIVFFGQPLSTEFSEAVPLLAQTDLCLILGTSLTVYPFAALPQLIPEHVPRILINRESVGTLGSRPNDVLLLGDCDTGIKKLATALGWLEELEILWASTRAEGMQATPSQCHTSAERSFEDEMEEIETGVKDTLAKTSSLTADIEQDAVGLPVTEIGNRMARSSISLGESFATIGAVSVEIPGLGHIYPHMYR